MVGALGWWMFWAIFRHAPGQDWVVFHTAAALARAGNLHGLADPQAFTGELNRTHDAWIAPLAFHPWVYPPVSLLLASAFGWLPYLWSLLGFLAVSLGALLAALWPCAPDARRRSLLAAGVLLCPATAYTLGAGQLSFAVAACTIAGAAWLPGRPFLAGAVFGLLCMKPQFAIMAPVALLASRDVRAIAGAAASAGLLVLVSLVAFGRQAWVDWLHLVTAANPDRAGLIDAVRLYDQSVDTCLRVLGAGAGLAAAGQGLAIAVSAFCVWRVYRRPARARARLVVLLCATVFAAPHVGGYDHVLVAVACMLTLEFGTGRAVLAVAAWCVTLFNPPALVAVFGVPALTELSAVTPLLVAGLMVAGVAQARDVSVSIPARLESDSSKASSPF